MSFKRDLNIGKQGEQFARAKLEELGYKTEDGDGKHIDFFLLANSKFSCECKFDVYANKSGNWAIEYYNSKICKPSGIESTTCDLWIHVIGQNEIYFNKVSALKKFIQDTKPDRDVSGGDNNSQMFLYKKDNICGKGLLIFSKENLNAILS